MFSALRQNSLFYILDKNNELTLKIGKVISVSSVQYKNNFEQTVNVVVNVDNEKINFDELPANLSTSESINKNYIVSESRDEISKIVENIVAESDQIVDSYDFHKRNSKNGKDILAKLNPKYAKEKEQEDKINILESKVNNIENGIDDMKAMMSKLLANKGD